MKTKMKVLAILALASSWSVFAAAATRQELNDQIKALTAQVDRETGQDVEVINAITQAVAPASSVTMGTVQGPTALTTEIPVYFKSGLHDVSSLQFDVAGIPGVTFSSADAGIAAKAANKSVTGNSVSGGFRVLIFGVNQDVIPSGPVAVLKADISSTAVLGKKVLTITGVTASDPAGQTVGLTGKNGSLMVRN